MDELPVKAKSKEDTTLVWRSFLQALLLGAACVWLPYLLVPFLKGQLSESNGHVLMSVTLVYTIGLTVILPLVQGYILGNKLAFQRVRITGWLPIPVLLVDLLLAVSVLKEGSICLIIAAPFLLFVVALGQSLGAFIAKRKNGKILNVMVFPLAVLAVALNTAMPPPIFKNAISDAVTINAPPEKVWKYVVRYPENNAPFEYWLWKIGLPAPMQSWADDIKVGARRECRFTGGAVFGEEITELIPAKVLTFKVTDQPNDPEILGHMSLDKGQMYLEANPDGTTTIIATSWYTLFVSPAFYFDWWAADTVRNVHFRVLNHIKRLAEADNI